MFEYLCPDTEAGFMERQDVNYILCISLQYCESTTFQENSDWLVELGSVVCLKTLCQEIVTLLPQANLSNVSNLRHWC